MADRICRKEEGREKQNPKDLGGCKGSALCLVGYSDGKPCSGVRGNQGVSTEFSGGSPLIFENVAVIAVLKYFEKGDKKMKNQTKKICMAGILCAVAVVGSLFSFPVFGSKCAPVQHMVNILCAVLLGPAYGVGAAFIASLIRNLFGLGSLLAFPGSMFGALLCGIAYKYSKKLWITLIGEVFGTGILGGLCAYPIAILFMGKNAGDIAFYAYVVPFLISTVGGAILAGILVTALQKTGALKSFAVNA